MLHKHAIVVRTPEGEMERTTFSRYTAALKHWKKTTQIRTSGECVALWYLAGKIYRRFRLDETWEDKPRQIHVKGEKPGVQGKTRRFNARIPEDVYATLEAEAKGQGVTLTDIVLQRLMA